MLVSQVASINIECLDIEESYSVAQNLAFDLDIFHIPIASKGKYLGLLPLNQLHTPEEKNTKIKEFQLDLIPGGIPETSYLIDIFGLFIEKDLTALSVIDNEGRFKGLLSQSDVIRYLSSIYSTSDAHAVITLRIKPIDYSLQEIARIVESNNAKIIHLYFEPNTSSKDSQCIIQLNKSDIAPILATFSRFGYDIISHTSTGQWGENWRDRYDLLMKYLNI